MRPLIIYDFLLLLKLFILTHICYPELVLILIVIGFKTQKISLFIAIA